MIEWMASEIEIADLAGLQDVIEKHHNDRHTWSINPNDPTYLYGDGDTCGTVAALQGFAPFIRSGYVMGQDEDGQPIRYVFVDGVAKKMDPIWVEEK
jgi:hypothetical protein